MGLFLTRGSHKQYSRQYFGAFNIFVIVFHSVFTKRTVGLYVRKYIRKYTHTVADFDLHTSTRNRTNTVQNNYNYRNTIYSNSSSGSNNNNNIYSATHITSRSVKFFLLFSVSPLHSFIYRSHRHTSNRENLKRHPSGDLRPACVRSLIHFIHIASYGISSMEHSTLLPYYILGEIAVCIVRL